MRDRKRNALPRAEQLRAAVDDYFSDCARQETTPTPSGLALALGVRTSALTDEGLSPAQQAIMERAMQRIEASVVELLLSRGGIKGMEAVLERVSEGGRASEEEQLLAMSDEEIRGRLKRLLPKLQKAAEEQESGAGASNPSERGGVNNAVRSGFFRRAHGAGGS